MIAPGQPARCRPGPAGRQVGGPGRTWWCLADRHGIVTIPQRNARAPADRTGPFTGHGSRHGSRRPARTPGTVLPSGAPTAACATMLVAGVRMEQTGAVTRRVRAAPGDAAASARAPRAARSAGATSPALLGSRLSRRAAAATLVLCAAAATGTLLSACASVTGKPTTGVPATLAPGGATFTGGTLPKRLHTVLKSGTLTAGATGTAFGTGPTGSTAK